MVGTTKLIRELGDKKNVTYPVGETGSLKLMVSTTKLIRELGDKKMSPTRLVRLEV